MGEDETPALSDVETWDRLLHDQTKLFRRTAARNVDLEARVEELEREVSVWKAAFKNSDDEKKFLSKNVLKLERNIGALREDNPLILCLIDGDGNIFSQDLITLGLVGGRQAAMLLTKGLTDHLASIDPSDAAPGRGQVWLTIYCNKNGLLETLMGNDVCTADQFEAFVIGFNQASPLFSIVDVGHGKEAADSKIKECLRVFTRFPQTSRVFFGGGHDNGYTSTLNYLQNEGLLDKIILLRGYKDLAHELKSLELPHLEIEGVFMTKKMHSNPFKKNKDVNQVIPVVQPHDFEKFRNKNTTPAINQRTPSPVKRPRQLDPDQPLHKQKPPPCNFYYLSECKQGQNCRYGHDYVLLTEHMNELKETAKRWPCPSINRGQRCLQGEACCMAHFCPKGPRCSFAKQGRCKFIGKNMHDKAATTPTSYRTGRRDFSSPSNAPSSPASQSLSERHLSPLASPTAGGLFLPDFDNGGPSRAGNGALDWGVTPNYPSWSA